MATNVTAPRLRQQGISLITVLVMLLLATLIVLSSTRLGWLSEKLVGSESDRQRAFAAAEALIRDAERDIKGLQADNATPCQPGVGFVGCRDFASGAPFFPEDINDLVLLEERMANTATGCLRGICLPASVGAMGRAAWIDNLAAMTDGTGNTSVAARYGEFTGVNPDAAGTCLPLFVARDAASPANRQPITTAPLWMKHPLGGRQILFGTGRHLEVADRSDTRVQTIYSVWDRSNYTIDTDRVISTVQERLPITNGRAALVRQTVTGNVTSRATGTELPTNYFNTSRNTVAYSTTNTSAPRGWYMDLPEARERVLRHPKIFEGQKVLVTSSDLPQGSADETCSPNGSRGNGWITVLNMITGRPSQTPVFETSDTTLNMDYASRARVDPDEFAAFEQKDGKVTFVQPPAPTNPLGPAPDPVNPPSNPPDTGYANGPGSNAPGTSPPQGTCLAGTLCGPRTSLLRHRDPGRRADWLELQ